ncbi:MAG: hypothetical protein KDB79_02385, partial [Acidobacteria bacterium]|nr:hypothetical protein [Acidobacteriota bacterium]
MSIKRFICSILAVTFTAFFVAAQDVPEKPDERVLGEVTVTSKMANADPGYLAIRGLSSDEGAFSGEYATVNNLVLKKDVGIFTFRSGEIYFLKEANGKRNGAVFIGDGELSLDPPVESEKRMLKFFTDETTLKEPFTQLVMFFTDKTFDEVKNSPNVKISTNGAQAGKARDAYKGKESLLKSSRFNYNMTTRILMDEYAPEREGFFWGFIDGKKYNSLVFKMDPLGVEEVSPEQVSLTNYDSNHYGIWLGFHLQSEYAKGTGNSNQDRTVYDITHHNIDVTLRGLRMIATDEMTLKIRTKGQRVLPFNLFPYMRVKRILDQDGQDVGFIQEDKDKDSELAVILPEARPVGEEFKLTFEYDGIESLTNEGTGNFILRSRTNWYPNNVGSRFLDRASFDLKFRYPKQYILIGVGELVDTAEDEGDLTYAHWSTKGVEMATAGFNYGDFKKHELDDPATGYELSVYNNTEVPAPLKSLLNRIGMIEAQRARYGQDSLAINIGSINTSSMAKTVLDEALNSVRLYDHYFGKLPHKRIAMTQQPRVGQGQAWATLVFMPYIAFISNTHRKELFGIQTASNEFWREVGPHEVAHQWWGHTVGWTSYRDQWMSEGFAELSSSLYVQFVYKDTDRFIKYWDDQRDLIVNGDASTKGIKPYTVGPVTQGRRLFNSKAPGTYRRLVYPKGAYILHMLRMLMIDPKAQGMDKDNRFIAMMKDFIKTHYNQDVSTEDFKRIVEKHITPQMDLYQNGSMDWFFDEWVYGTEVPKYELEYEIGSSKGQTILNAKITQSEVSDRFVMPVPVYVDYGKGWVELGKATIVGNKTYELKNIALPVKPKKVA